MVVDVSTCLTGGDPNKGDEWVEHACHWKCRSLMGLLKQSRNEQYGPRDGSVRQRSRSGKGQGLQN